MTKLYQAVLRVEARVAATFLVAMVLLIFSGGIARLMGEPLNWTTDAATCLFAWACFLCADVAWRRDALMSVEVLTDRLPPRWQKLLRLVNYLLIGAFLVYVTTMGLSFPASGSRGRPCARRRGRPPCSMPPTRSRSTLSCTIACALTASMR
jgi:TRAP-type C4-dicarboxylate transport system permease small subunit